MQASICIFQNNVQYEQDDPVVETPEEVFLAVKRVAASKKSEFVKLNQGLFYVEFAEQGPFRDGFGAEDWLPVKVYRFEQWRSGGVRGEEMLAFVQSKEDTEE